MFIQEQKITSVTRVCNFPPNVFPEKREITKVIKKLAKIYKKVYFKSAYFTTRNTQYDKIVRITRVTRVSIPISLFKNSRCLDGNSIAKTIEACCDKIEEV